MNKTQQNLAIISLIAAPLFALAATSSDAESGSRCGQDREHEAGRHRGPGMAEHGMHHRLSQLDLTAQQQDPGALLFPEEGQFVYEAEFLTSMQNAEERRR